MRFPEVGWDKLRLRFDEIAKELLSPTLDVFRRKPLSQEHARLAELLGAYDRLVSIDTEISQLEREAMVSEDSDFKILCEEEVARLRLELSSALAAVENFLYPPDERDDCSAFVEIRAGTGGQEAALFAADLARMYTLYAFKKGWRVSVISESPTDLGGVRELVLHIQGKQVYGHLKHESGVHRVQRVPKTETSGRIHTSTATVAVLPEVKDVEFTVNPDDLRIDVFRSGGAGGQHVNTTDSAVRITHIPTGIVVSCQDERSQHKNKAKALKVLKSRLMAFEREKAESEKSQMRKEMVGTGERAEKVRTYNFPQNRVSDHQVGLTLSKLDRVVEGDLDEIVEALMRKEQEERRKNMA
ncbi:MAG: peptide chain release factor 1 [Candidatus Babeliaceae bacterium]|nr:peptide chain release factor 1 [Candidatus Babeliaceae bacterium]